jgi:putative ATPase
MKPLATILRPNTIDEVVGQRHLLGEGCLLRKLVENDQITSAIFYGPAGTGKTSIANVIANQTKSHFMRLSATSAKVSDIRKIATAAKTCESKKTIIFIDEIHRFSKAQTDVLLPYIEDGDIIFIGATTENPFHSMASPLISRSQIFQFEPLSARELGELIVNAIRHYRMDDKHVVITHEAIRHIIRVSCGDGRKAISIVDMIKKVAPSKYTIFSADEHFDLASWMQGAIQASDPDSAVFALAKWLESGEDPRYIARRVLVSAAEDAYGNPICTAVAHAAYTAAKEIGRPECDIVLSQAVCLIASSKRNKAAANAIWGAVSDVRKKVDVCVPKTMRDAHYAGAEKLGQGAYKDGRNQEVYVGVNKRYYRNEEEL